MKVKVKPEDFQVREESSPDLGPDPAEYSLFRLTKREWDTFDLLDLLSRRLGVKRADIRLGGYKDRHGDTSQLLCVRSGGRSLAELEERNFSLRFLGYSSQPLSAQSVRGNHFRITLRDMREGELRACLEACEQVRRWGFPNYYGEQRFGSARHGKGLMGKEVFLRRRERALRLYFEPSREDDAKTRMLKSCLQEHWGGWEKCLPLACGGFRPLLEYLSVHPRAFKKALALIDRRLLVFMLHAYQSFLFNEILSDYLLELQRQHGFSLHGLPYRMGEYRFYACLPEELFGRLRETYLPVPAHDSEIREPVISEITRRVLEREGVELKDLKARQISRLRIKSTERRMIVLPEGFIPPLVGEDELYPQRKKLILEFFLPRGSYATLLIRRIGLVLGADPQAG